MGHEISNLQSIFGGFRVLKMFPVRAGVISFVPEAKTDWDYNLFFSLYMLPYMVTTHLMIPDMAWTYEY